MTNAAYVVESFFINGTRTDQDEGSRLIARRLIQVVEDHCRAAGCTRLDFDMINLREELPASYAKFGFLQVGTAEMGDRHKLTQPCCRIQMSKPL